MTIKYKCLYEITGCIEDVNTFLVPLRELPKEPETQHWSDCAVHNEPAYQKGECDCGGFSQDKLAMMVAMAALKELVAQVEGRFLSLKHDHFSMQDARVAIRRLDEALNKRNP